MNAIYPFIRKQLKPFHWHILLYALVAFIWAIDLSARPYIIKIIIDRMTITAPSHTWHNLFWLVILYIGLTLLMVVTFRIWNIVRRNFIPYLKGNITRYMTTYLLQHSYRYYQGVFAGSLANKINDVAYGVSQLVEIVINDFLANSLALIIAAAVLFTVRPMVAVIYLTWTVIFVLGSRYFAKNTLQLSDRSSELRSQLTGKIVDILGNMSIVRLFSRQKFEADNIKNWTNNTVAAERAFDWKMIVLFAFQGFSFLFLQAVLLLYLIHARSKDQITIGDFALVFTVNVYLVDTLWNLGRQFITFTEQLGKVTQGLNITMQAHDLLDAPHAQDLRVRRGEIKFNNIIFAYKSQSPLFNKLSVSIQAGQKVGLVGHSGSGKTTFANLILRLFDIQAGCISIDEQDISKVTQQSLRDNISLIPQDPTLFHRSLLENIAYGNPSSSFEEVQEAAQKAHADGFIKLLPEGYNTLVGERGIKLSGGQRQRIAIARAILKNAPILLLDEATSALDSITEHLIQESLTHLMKGKTTIVIAHRLSTLLHMDRILVFEKGVIVEDGNHQDLLKQSGLYAKLWHSQVHGFLPD